MANFTGDSDDNTQTGSTDADLFDYGQGGHDSLDGGDGADTFAMEGSLDAQDVINGGDGFDTVELVGDYMDLALTGPMLADIEEVDVSGGDYSVVISSDILGVSGELFVTANGDSNRFDASALTGSIHFTANNSSGSCDLTGGSGDDTFQSQSVTRQMSYHGGAGDDGLTIGFTSGELRAAARTFTGIETITYIGNVELALNDANVAAGEVLHLTAYEPDGGGSPTHPPAPGGPQLNLDGHKETDGHLVVKGGASTDNIFGGHQDDTLRGGGGDDYLTGNDGRDRLHGGAGSDAFFFGSVTDSHKGAADLITDLTNDDVISLGNMDADITQDGKQHFTLVAELSSHAGELALVYDAERNITLFLGDTDGDAKADLVIEAIGDHTDFTNFIDPA